MAKKAKKEDLEKKRAEQKQYVAKTLFEYLKNLELIEKVLGERAHKGFTPNQLEKRTNWNIDQVKAILKSMATYGCLRINYTKANRLEYTINPDMVEADLAVDEVIKSLELQAKQLVAQAEAYKIVLEVIREYMEAPDEKADKKLEKVE